MTTSHILIALIIVLVALTLLVGAGCLRVASDADDQMERLYREHLQDHDEAETGPADETDA